jgi:hypothetical protein
MSTITRRPTTHAAPAQDRAHDWRDDAACARTDPELFFPQGQPTTAAAMEEAAKRICAGCPVRAECLEYALETGQHTGVWGGCTESERRQLARVRQPSMDRCLDAQEWIEDRLAAGVPQKAVARELGVQPGVLCRAVRRFRDERAAAAEGVRAA